MTVFSINQGKLKQFVERRVLFGQELSLELAAILLVYFVQGILGLARLAVSFFLKDDLGLTPAEVAALTGIASIPWTVKPLLGFFSDGFPILGYRRRPYLVLSGLLGAVSWLALATLVNTAWAAIAAITLSSLSVAIGDVIVDSLVVERARNESQSEAGSLQSLAWGASAVGGVITAYLGGLLLEYVGTRYVFGITAAFPLIVSLVAWLIAEDPVTETSTWQVIGGQIKQLKGAITQKVIWMPALFIFLWQATPTAESAFFFFTTNDLGFQPEFLGRVRLVTSIAALIGIWIFQRFLKSVPFRSIFAWSTILSTVLGFTMLLLVTHTNRSLGIPDEWFSLGDSLILTVMGEISFMPLLVLSARICPSGVEATLFALLMSILNLAGLLSHELGAILTHWLGVTETNFENLWLLVTLTNLSTLLPLPLLFLLPKASSQGPNEETIYESLPAAETPEISSNFKVKEPIAVPIGAVEAESS
ncbi:folate/biopterin family MFS transporter [Oscillatoria sp. CS-180]|uniref:folate/biopterin family MFS transporter n=1 Tax=Oscillatoria sp. CS-180 TaxID=3021720 RepID=UPI00232B8BDF|nr:folate/biopterin family MFS transporter [Oscillatoria sp. CS-180]MDB9528848.1 folate/biopterin family MFS transporter [Oscillatoria sp. CS-180]